MVGMHLAYGMKLGISRERGASNNYGLFSSFKMSLGVECLAFEEMVECELLCCGRYPSCFVGPFPDFPV
jgi:hypothetical protein